MFFKSAGALLALRVRQIYSLTLPLRKISSSKVRQAVRLPFDDAKMRRDFDNYRQNKQFIQFF